MHDATCLSIHPSPCELASEARLEIEALYDGTDFSETLTRARFEELNADLFKNTLGPVKQVLEARRFATNEKTRFDHDRNAGEGAGLEHRAE